MIKELNEAKEEILLHNALDWKKFKILVAVCCSYAVRELCARFTPLGEAVATLHLISS